MSTISVLASLFFLMGWKPSVSSVPSIHSEVNRDNGTIGDKFHYKVIIRTKEEHLVIIPENQQQLSSFIVKERTIRTKTRKGLKETILEYELVSYDVGKDTIPVISFVVNNGADSYELKTESTPVEIMSVSPEMTGDEDIKDIKPQIGMKLSFWYYIIGFLVLLTIITLVFFFIRWKKKKKITEEFRTRSPWEIALLKLEEIGGIKPESYEEIKVFYTRLSFILREYFELLYDFPAVENTTTEILDYLKRVKEYNQYLSNTNDFLRRSDLVKFAKYSPPVFDKEKEVVFVRKVVEGTMIEEEKDEEKDV